MRQNESGGERSSHRATSIAGILGFVLTACGSTPHRGVESVTQPIPASVVPLTDPIILVADTQFQHPFGETFIERSSLADAVISSALRPPQLEMFSDAMVLQACGQTDLSTPVIHLGDGGNTSCSTELEQLFDVMDRCRRKRQWAFTPGNHDGFLLGNSDDLCDPDYWGRACDGKVLSKDVLMARLRDRAREIGVATSESDATCDASDGKVEVVEGAPESLVLQTASCVGTTPETRASSFFLQLLRLSPPAATSRRVLGILLDTTQYALPPRLWPEERNAGMTGSVLDDQWAIVEAWLVENRDALFVLLGHHDFQSLTSTVQRRMLRLVSEYPNVVLYVSAHTHAEAFHRHGGSEDALIELNVGSMIDYPVGFRDMRLLQDGDRVLLSSRFDPSVLSFDQRWPDCQEDWFPPDRDFTAYVRQPNPGGRGLDRQLLRARAEMWVRLIDQVGYRDTHAQASVREDLRSALDADEQQREKLEASIKKARALDARERPEGVVWVQSCRSALPAARASIRSGSDLRLACRRHDFKRCIALRASQMERCSNRCHDGSVDARFVPRSDEVVVLRTLGSKEER